LLRLTADFLLVFSTDLKSRWNRCQVSLLADKVDESNPAAKRRTLRSTCKIEPLLPRNAAKHEWNLEGKKHQQSEVRGRIFLSASISVRPSTGDYRELLQVAYITNTSKSFTFPIVRLNSERLGQHLQTTTTIRYCTTTAATTIVSL